MMHQSYDCRDRTAEFFSTIAALQKAQGALSRGSELTDGTSHRPLPLSSKPFSSSSSSSSNGFGNEFDDRPEGAPLHGGGGVPPKQQSQFTQAAQHIGRSIHMVTEKLEKLGKCQTNEHVRSNCMRLDCCSDARRLTLVVLLPIHLLFQWLASAAYSTIQPPRSMS